MKKKSAILELSYFVPSKLFFVKYIYLFILSISFILIFPSLSYSQVEFGVKSGINIATTKGIITFPKNRLGWYLGGSSYIPIQKKLFLQPELLFSSTDFPF